MAITVTRARVKEKCNISDATSDATIDNLIAELVPVIEFAIQSASLADTALATTLNLGAAEVVCGEFLAQRKRLENAEPPAGGAARPFDPTDPSRMAGKGWERLRPYLKVDSRFAVPAPSVGGANVKPAEEVQ